MALSLLCGVLVTRSILADGGQSEYALYAVLVAIPAVISFTDLGAGAALVNELSSGAGPKAPHVRAVAVSVTRYLGVVAGVLVLLAVLASATGSWRLLLGSAGESSTAPLAATFSTALFALSVALGIWGRVLLGLGENHISNLVNGLQAPMVLAFVLAFLHTGHGGLASLGYFSALVAVTVLGYSVARRRSQGLMRGLMGEALRWRTVQGASILGTALPWLAQGIAAPLTMQSDRIVLPHLVDASGVATYAVCSQVFLALQALVSAAGLPLWPRFARERAAGRVPRVRRWALAFLFFAAACTLLVSLVSVPLFTFVSAGQVHVSVGVVLAFGAALVAQATVYPLGMAMMDKRGLRRQVAPVIAAGIVSPSLTLVLVPLLGVAGAPLGTAIAIGGCQLVPYIVFVALDNRTLRRREMVDVS